MSLKVVVQRLNQLLRSEMENVLFLLDICRRTAVVQYTSFLPFRNLELLRQCGNALLFSIEDAPVSLKKGLDQARRWHHRDP
jgi:hypothetical protein